MTRRSPDVLDLVPSARASASMAIDVVSSPPSDVTTLGVSVASGGEVPPELEVSREELSAAGFGGEVGQAIALPGTDPLRIAFGVGEMAQLDAAALRDAAAALALAAWTHTKLALALPDDSGLEVESAAAAAVEGAVLARYGYDALRAEPEGMPLEQLTVIAAETEGAARGARRGGAMASATQLAGDLANAPPGYMTATAIAEVAVTLAAEHGLEAEVLDEQALLELGCGGMLGVNRGTVEPPRMVKLSYKPGAETGRLALVGKGVMCREHAVGHGCAPRRRSHDPRWQDRGGDQHRRRGPADHGRRARHGH